MVRLENALAHIERGAKLYALAFYPLLSLFPVSTGLQGYGKSALQAYSVVHGAHSKDCYCTGQHYGAKKRVLPPVLSIIQDFHEGGFEEIFGLGASL